MAAAPFAWPTGLPSPQSPVSEKSFVSENSFDSSMILPHGDDRSISPVLFAERPPSPSSFYAHANLSAHTITLRRPSPRFRNSPPLSSQSSHSTLRNMNASQTNLVPKGALLADDALVSSPAVQDSSMFPGLTQENGHVRTTPPKQRRSSATSSLDSEDLELIRTRWPGFDSQEGFDDSAVDLEEEESQDQFPVEDARANGTENESWQNGGHRETSESTYSSDLYAKRAEMILADAKRRLNVMEGNLRGARQSLVVSPTFNSSVLATEFQHQINAARERDRRLYAGIGPIPPRNRPFQSSPLSSNGSPIHARGMSETSVPLPFPSRTFIAKAQQSKRASSAMGHGSGPWSPETYGNGRFPIRESRSYEVMRDPRGNGLGQEDSLRSHSRGSRSPPGGALETLPEDESPRLERSPSTTSSLRDQVNDLKGRISSLRMRTQEDSLRRKSQQSLRAPSPFTSAETWYSGGDMYKAQGSPISADAGVGYKPESTTRKALYDDESHGSTPKDLATSPQPDHTYAVKEVNGNGDRSPPELEDAFHYDNGDWEEHQPEENEPRIVGLGLDMAETEDEFISADEDTVDAGSSIYEDAVYEMPASGRHEDRIDAFDYEHFFLHSAMGTYSADRPGSSASSDSNDSVATTKPVTTIHTRNVSTGSAKRVSMHQRNSSVASVSTVASFATATEGLSEDDEENPQMDQFSKQILPNSQPAPQSAVVPPRLDSLPVMQKSNGSSSSSSTLSRVSSPGTGDLLSGLQTSKIFSILLESRRDQPQLSLDEEEKQLIYSLAATFQSVCGNLKSTAGDQYERKEWRRRLDEARRVLNGEDPEGQPF